MNKILKLAITVDIVIYAFIQLQNFLFGPGVLYSASSAVLWGAYYVISLILILYYAFVRNNQIAEYIKSLVKKLSSYFSKSLQGIVENILYLIEAVIFVLYIQAFFLGHVEVPTASMFPIIQEGDHYLVNMVKNKFVAPQRDNIFVLDSPEKKMSLCKRLVALPGERLEIKEGRAYIDGKSLEKTYSESLNWKVPKKGDIIQLKNALFQYEGKLYDEKELRNLRLLSLKNVEILDRGSFYLDGEETGPIFDTAIYLDLVNDGETQLMEDLYVFLGDNTYNSRDSRHIGFINRSRIKGELLLRIWPLSRIGHVS